MSERNFSKFSPVSAAERRAALAGENAAAPPRSPSSDKPASRSRKVKGKPAPAAAEADAPRFVGGALRRLTIPLVCPVEYRGKVYSEITLKRATALEVGAYFELLAAEPDETHPFPIFFDEDGKSVPAKVIAGLDDEDDELVMKAAQDFLSPRLLAMGVRQ